MKKIIQFMTLLVGLSAILTAGGHVKPVSSPICLLIAFDKEPDFNGITNNYTIQNGFSFGAGIEYHLNDNWSMTIDAVRYIDKVAENGVVKYASKVDNATLGVLYRF